MGVLRLPKILLQPVVASRSDTTAVSIVFVLSPLRPPAVTRHPSPRAGSCSTGLPPVPLTVETSGSPRFLGSHTYRSAPLLDPGRASLPGLLSAVPFCPRFNNHEGPFDLPRFRGSLTRLSGSLSTLPRLRYLRRARLASGWWPTSFRVGLVTHMAPLKGFRSILSSQGITSPFPRLRLAPCFGGEIFSSNFELRTSTFFFWGAFWVTRQWGRPRLRKSARSWTADSPSHAKVKPCLISGFPRLGKGFRNLR